MMRVLTTPTLLGVPLTIQEIIARQLSGRGMVSLSRASRRAHSMTARLIEEWGRELPREGEVLAYLRERLELAESFSVAFYRPARREVLTVKVSFPLTAPIHVLGTVEYIRTYLNDDGSVGYATSTRPVTTLLDEILFQDVMPRGLVDPETTLCVMRRRLSCVERARRREVDYGVEEVRGYATEQVDALASTLLTSGTLDYRIAVSVLWLLAYAWRSPARLEALREGVVEGGALPRWLEARHTDALRVVRHRLTVESLSKVVARLASPPTPSHVLRPPLSAEVVAYYGREVASTSPVRLGLLRGDTVYVLSGSGGLPSCSAYAIVDGHIREVPIPATFSLEHVLASRRLPGLPDPYSHHEVALSLEGSDDWDEPVYSAFASSITRGYLLGAFRELVAPVLREADGLYTMRSHRIADQMKGMRQSDDTGKSLEEVRRDYHLLLLRTRLRLYYWVGVGTDAHRRSLMADQDLSREEDPSRALVHHMLRVLRDLRAAYDAIQ
jgi:hypothetical protein